MFEKTIYKVLDFYYTHKKRPQLHGKKAVRYAIKRIDANPNYYKSLHYGLKNDLEVLVFALRKDYTLLEFAPHCIRDDMGFIKRAIFINPYAVQFASKRLKNYRKLALFSVLHEPNTYKFLSLSMQNDPTILEMIERKRIDFFKRDIKLFQHICFGDEVGDKDFIYAKTQKDAGFIKKASTKIQEDRYFIMDLVSSNPLALKHIKREFRNDSEIVLATITPKLHATKEEKQKCAQAFCYISSTLKSNPEFLQNLLDVNPYVKKYMKG